MQEKELALLFENGALNRCVITHNDKAGEGGYIAMFYKLRDDKKSFANLETRPRKAGDKTKTRVFKTIDAACSLIKRQVGFNQFDVREY